MAKITISAFGWVPPFAQGLVRDMRARWALEELGLKYDVQLLNQEMTSSKEYLSLQPFGLVPVYEEDGMKIFESGAILTYLAEKSEVLMPRDPAGRARTLSWMFAALNTVEPLFFNLSDVDLFSAKEEWAKLRRPSLIEEIQDRLQDLSNWLEGKQYLELERFTAADLLMTTVLRIPRHTKLVADFPVLEAYRLRCEARPAFQRALAAQMSTFEKHSKKDT